MRILLVFLICVAGSVQAATVSITGTVFRITGPDDFLNAVPVAVGDAFRMTATMDPAPTTNPSSSGTFFLDAFTSMSGTVGGYSFAQALQPDGFRPIPVNRAFLQDDVNGVDRAEARSSVAGANVGPYQANLLTYTVRDSTAGMLDDEAFSPSRFDQPFIDALRSLPRDANGRLQYDAQAVLLFRDDAARQSGGNVWADLKVSPPPLAPVPLPASGWLLLGGLALAGFAQRRTKIQGA